MARPLVADLALARRLCVKHPVGVTVTPEETRASNTVDELYRKHGAEVYRYAYSVLGNRPDAEDMTQSTFVNALRALERGEQPRRPGNWLITIAHNVARERFRRSQARPTEVSFDIDSIEAGSSAGDDAVSLAELTRALGRIPAPQRSALVLREFEGRPYAEIARILGITTSALETLLFRARRSLAEELENVVTCERAVLDIDRLQSGSIGRKDRRRLDDHVRECGPCARLLAHAEKPTRLVRGLAWLPLWFPLDLFRSSGHKVLMTAASHSPGAAAGASGGGVALGAGLAAKVAAVVVTTTVAGGIGYGGVHQIRAHSPTRQPAEPAARTTGGATQATKPTARVGPKPSAARRTTSQFGVAHRTVPATMAAGGLAVPPQSAVPHVDSGSGRTNHTVGGTANGTGGSTSTAPGKSASAPRRDPNKTTPSNKPDTTKQTPPGQARKAADTTAESTPPSDPTTSPGNSSAAPGQSESYSTAGKSGDSSNPGQS